MLTIRTIRVNIPFPPSASPHPPPNRSLPRPMSGVQPAAPPVNALSPALWRQHSGANALVVAPAARYKTTAMLTGRNSCYIGPEIRRLTGSYRYQDARSPRPDRL